MPRVAVLGANGQVGAELCLLLAQTTGIDLVPVCRNPTGSAFLRYAGIACRHGLAADFAQATQLFGDCDAIVNCALGTGTPREIRAFDRTLIRNIFDCSKPDATIIHCSTLMVHGDPRPGRLLRLRDSYGNAKLAAEKQVRLASKRSGKPNYILRLGHVCGQLQNITHKIRREVSSGEVVLPAHDVPSNTVFTVTIVDAILSILGGKEFPGTFDLTNVPQWTWRQLYEYESALTGQSFSAHVANAIKSAGIGKTAFGSIRAIIGRGARTKAVRRAAEKWLVLAPASLNGRAQAIWSVLRARAEINAIIAEREPAPELSWIRMDFQSLRSLQPTKKLLEQQSQFGGDMTVRWPRDLALASEVQHGFVAQTT
jgi:nucleoside-diphosphate-sugar epimerase